MSLPKRLLEPLYVYLRTIVTPRVRAFFLLEFHRVGGVVCGGISIQLIVGLGGESVKLLPKASLL